MPTEIPKDADLIVLQNDYLRCFFTVLTAKFENSFLWKYPKYPKLSAYTKTITYVEEIYNAKVHAKFQVNTFIFGRVSY